MSKDFREHSKNYGESESGKNASNANGVNYGDLPPEGQAEYDRLKSAAKKYENKSESELTDELFKKITQSKKDGTFDPASVQRFAAQVAPMLTAEQRKKLQQLLKMIK